MNLALFDFDGTITSADTFTPFVRFAVSRPRVVLGTVLLSPLILGYELGVLPTTKIRAAVAHVGFRGRSEAEVNALGERYAEKLDAVVRPEARERMLWHQSSGDEVVVVSASLGAYLRGWCRKQGISLICTELEAERGRLTGRYTGGDCTGPEKARRVRERYDLSQYARIYAYGDSPEDEHLLALAHERWFAWRKCA